MQQQSEEWFNARLGRATASRVADVMAKTKSGPSASRANYMADLIVERLTGTRAEGFESAAMIWGRTTEPQARAAYEFHTDAEVVEEGFCLHPAIPDFGASPDGLIGDLGLLEIKCPNTAAHLEVLLTGTVPGKYVTQMQAQMACTGRAWCDFVSFDPRMPGEMQMFLKRVHRDDAFIAEMEDAVTDFLTELAQKLDALRAQYSEAA